MDLELRDKINTTLIEFFNEIMDLEEKAIITDEFKDITNNDMHIIAAIGLGEGNRMSVIAKKTEYYGWIFNNIHECISTKGICCSAEK